MFINIKKIAFAIAITWTSCSALAGDITITNHSDAYVTGQTDSSPCSAIIGDQGIIPPQSSPKTVPQVVFDMYCPKVCDVYVYPTKNCSGGKVATIKVDYARGVVSVTNHASQYTVAGSGNSVAIYGKK